jgi:hypothetical protein
MHNFLRSSHGDVVFVKTVPLIANTGRMQSAFTSFSLFTLCVAALTFGLFKLLHCKKRLAFSRPQLGCHSPWPGRVCLVTSRLWAGKRLNFFYSVILRFERPHQPKHSTLANVVAKYKWWSVPGNTMKKIR